MLKIEKINASLQRTVKSLDRLVQSINDSEEEEEYNTTMQMSVKVRM